jgi:hypothetical protein
MIIGCIMFVFEAAKQALFPTASIWTSHPITVLFTTLAAFVILAVLMPASG